MRILVLLYEAFGGRGHSARYQRDLLTALCSHPGTKEVVCLPRVVTEDIGPIPKKLDFQVWASGGKALYAAAMAKALASPGWWDLILCGHLHLLPALRAFELRKPTTPTALTALGAEAWAPYGGEETTRQLSRIEWFLTPSDFSRRLFCAWSTLPAEKGLVIPHAVDLERCVPGVPRREVIDKHRLRNKTVLVSMAKLDTRERDKGVDEVLEILPTLLKEHPKLAYVICGDGTDRPRLEQKARELGLGDKVVFAGFVPESERIEYFRAADVFLHAGWGESFGPAAVEAMACGAPTVASSLDASAEAVGGGRFGFVVNPKQPVELLRGVQAALARGRARPAGLETFSQAAFERRVHTMILDPLAQRGRPQ